MVFLITGASHTGKTLLAQRLLERCSFPCLSIDLLKMGLIRSKNTHLTPDDDDALAAYLWPIVREIVKTAIENRQNLIIEGCYIPFGWKQDLEPQYLEHIRWCCLVMSREYILGHFSDIKGHANEIEQRLDDTGCTLESVLRDNEAYLRGCRQNGCSYFLIEDGYPPAEQLLRELLEQPGAEKGAR